MEVAHANEMPNYAGGLGVLAADTIMSAADLGLDMVGVSLLYHQNDDLEYGFNGQRYMILRPETVEVEIEDRKVKIAIWEKEIIGRGGHVVPVYFLSAHVASNPLWDRDLTKYLYASDRYTRLGQEVILGVGGVRALEALGHKIDVYHLNEGHAAFATLELLRRNGYDEAKVRSMVTFTTHTPIAAGHDYFDYALAGNVLRTMMPWDIRTLAGNDQLGMTELAMSLSKSTNSVSKRHQTACQEMFPGKTIHNVTNGIYAPRWAGDRMTELFDARLPEWGDRPAVFRDAVTRLSHDRLRTARAEEKADFVRWINFNKGFFSVTNVSNEDFLDEHTLTIGFGRRTVPYKRAELLFREIDRLAELGDKKLQLIFASRCHPDDQYCNALRGNLNEFADRLRGKVKIVLIPDYDLKIAKRQVVGCDVWLNTPTPPLEASGTSGMKAALNGGLNLSMRDGWWIEGLEQEPMSGWGFGGERYATQEEQDANDARVLMDALQDVVACYYDRQDEWTERMKHAIALLGFFNTSRLVEEYEKQIWQA
jgi:starch phosphorylase